MYAWKHLSTRQIIIALICSAKRPKAKGRLFTPSRTEMSDDVISRDPTVRTDKQSNPAPSSD
ncbi:MAG TPA: hypothetical protein DCF61_07895 [Alphaproteobacteria bacterium]|jgi:hypothetical protein|nr:hypothetical protein [Alphaproteobacteria bacterium]HAM46253.1 hypothetical protein [Alphaproteobacteria bacterium]